MFSWKDIEKYKGHWKAERLDMESWNHQPADTQVHGFGIKTVRTLKTHIQNSWLFNFFQSLLSLYISNMVTHKTLKPTPPHYQVSWLLLFFSCLNFSNPKPLTHMLQHHCLLHVLLLLPQMPKEWQQSTPPWLIKNPRRRWGSLWSWFGLKNWVMVT